MGRTIIFSFLCSALPHEANVSIASLKIDYRNPQRGFDGSDYIFVLSRYRNPVSTTSIRAVSTKISGGNYRDPPDVEWGYSTTSAAGKYRNPGFGSAGQATYPTSKAA